ncbi:MAG TPA: hypothetical protein VKU39_21585 [Streptosporangiaceae bacterium]|nr:hypothetical protein [Streptosporangiaceae bacterium]
MTGFVTVRQHRGVPPPGNEQAPVDELPGNRHGMNLQVIGGSVHDKKAE